MTWKDVVIGLALAGIVVLGAGLVFGGLWGSWGWWGRMPMMGWGMGFGMFLFPLLFLVLIIAVFGWRDRRMWGPHRGSRELEIVRERYAKGEITREQFEQMLRDLGYQ